MFVCLSVCQCGDSTSGWTVRIFNCVERRVRAYVIRKRSTGSRRGAVLCSALDLARFATWASKAEMERWGEMDWIGQICNISLDLFVWLIDPSVTVALDGGVTSCLRSWPLYESNDSVVWTGVFVGDWTHALLLIESIETKVRLESDWGNEQLMIKPSQSLSCTASMLKRNTIEK